MTIGEFENIKNLVEDYNYVQTARPDILHDFFVRLTEDAKQIREDNQEMFKMLKFVRQTIVNGVYWDVNVSPDGDLHKLIKKMEGKNEQK